MANVFTSSGIVWILYLISASQCWDLEELKPVSCPDGDTEEGICYSMVDQQVRCVNLTVGPCDEILESSTDGIYGVRSYVGHNDICLKVASGYCTQYSCRRQCCSGVEIDDGECISPYCNKECHNGGACIWSLNGEEKIEKCECTSPYKGENCEIVHCDRGCENGGTCVIDGSDTTCTCPDGYYGTTCSFLARDLDFQPECPDWNWNLANYGHHENHGHHGNHGHQSSKKCKENQECSGGRVCCFTGSCRECVEPTVSCFHRGKRYHPGDVITEKCEECRCSESGKIKCSEVVCPSVSCGDGEILIRREGECCSYCSGITNSTNEAITFWNCREGDIKRLPVRRYTSVGMLEDLGIKATDYRGNFLQVKFSPSHVAHCKCTTVHRPHTYVMATARDQFGRSSTCGFRVVVYDYYDPVYNSCPADIFAQEGEFVAWNEPRANDYVGLRQQSCDTENGQIFEVGTHRVTCTAVDFDNNKAFCQFTVYVYKSENSDGDMPAGLQARRKKTINSTYVIVATFSAIFVVILLVFIGCFINRRRMNQQRCQSRDQHDRDSVIHTVGDGRLYDVIANRGEFKLPPYSPKCEPPAYDEINSSAADMMPPTYDCAITSREGNPNIRRGFLNEAYARIDVPSSNQQTVPPPEEEVYEEISLN